jgi:hypothetical protein
MRDGALRSRIARPLTPPGRERGRSADRAAISPPRRKRAWGRDGLDFVERRDSAGPMMRDDRRARDEAPGETRRAERRQQFY